MSFMFIFGVKVDFPLNFAVVIIVYERRDWADRWNGTMNVARIQKAPAPYHEYGLALERN